MNNMNGAKGAPLRATIILFGRRASSEGYGKIEVKGGSGIRYDAVGAESAPGPARAALG